MATATEPDPMSRTAAIAYAVGLPLGLLALVFLPVGRLHWSPGWYFIAFVGLNRILAVNGRQSATDPGDFAHVSNANWVFDDLEEGPESTCGRTGRRVVYVLFAHCGWLDCGIQIAN